VTSGYPTGDIVLGFKGQGHRVTKCKIKLKAGVSLCRCQVSTIYSYFHKVTKFSK